MSDAFTKADPADESGPLVSVFTAVHQPGEVLIRAYESMVSQTYPHWEWVLMDDSTSPESAMMITRFLSDTRTQGRLRWLHHQPPLDSVGASKSAAAGSCFGDILVELDQDDELFPYALEVLAATFVAYPEIDFAYSDWVDWIDMPEGGFSGTFSPGWGFGFGSHSLELIGSSWVQVQLAPAITPETIRHIVAAPNHVRAWRRRMYHQVGGHDPSLPVADDYDLIVRTFLEGTFARIPRPLYVQHHDPQGSNTSRRRNAEIQRLVQSLAASYKDRIDQRCEALGAHRSPSNPLTSFEPWTALNSRVDVLTEASSVPDNSFVSVIMPTSRRPDKLRKAIRSVLAQSHTNFELLVVGDGCPDAEAIVTDINDSRIRFANLSYHHSDGGASPRNFALRAMCRGKFVAYLDDDNVWDTNHLKITLALFEDQPELSFVFSSFRSDGEDFIAHTPSRYLIDTSTLVHRIDLIEKHGGWRPSDDTGGAHDWELVSRWSTEKWAATKRATITYNIDPLRHDPLLLATIRQTAANQSANT